MDWLADIAREAIFALLLWSFVNAGILVWRARKLKDWVIRFMDAYVVSLKAGLMLEVSALLAAFIGGIIFGILGVNLNGTIVVVLVMTFALRVWWITHCRALMKLAATGTPLTIQDARTISTSVLGYWAVAFVILVLVPILIMVVGSTIK